MPVASMNPYQEKPAEEMVLYEKIDRHIARVTLTRPEKGDAILHGVMEIELAKALERGQNNDEVKAIILAGSGRHFCSGEDVRRMPIESARKKGEKLPQSFRMRFATVDMERTKRMFLYNSKTIIAVCQGGAGVGDADGAVLRRHCR